MDKQLSTETLSPPTAPLGFNADNLDRPSYNDNNISNDKTNPQLSIKSPKTIAIRIMSQEEMDLCPFWIGLFKKGPLPCPSLLDFKQISTLLNKAAEEGIDENESLMLCDSINVPCRYIYLYPNTDIATTDMDSWVDSLTTRVKSWSPSRVGIYFAPNLLSKSQSEQLTLAIIRSLIPKANTNEFFLLPGAYGMNAVLNIAIQLKYMLEQDNVTAYIFH